MSGRRHQFHQFHQFDRSANIDLESDTKVIPESPPTEPITEPIPTIPLPLLDQTYDTPEAGITAINNHGRIHGYAVISRRSKRTKKGVKKTIRLCCDRWRALPIAGTNLSNPEANLSEANLSNFDTNLSNANPKRTRNSTTVANECPFGISFRLQFDTGTWHITVENSLYNHDPSPLSTHPVHRQSDLIKNADNIQQQLTQGIPTRQILSRIQESDPDTFISRDIYNFRKKVNIEFLTGRTPLQALLIEPPRDNEWIFKYEVDDEVEKHVTALFYIHKSSITLVKSNP